MANSDTVKSVQRAIDIVEQVGRADDGLRLGELAARLDLKKTTVHNLVKTLRVRGFMIKDDANRYRLGPMFEELTRHRYRRGVFRRAETAMLRLHTGIPAATLTFSELVGNEICCRLRMAPEFPGNVQRPQSQTFSPFGSASGLCLYAFNPDYRDLMSDTEAFDESGRRYWANRTDFEQAVAETSGRGVAVITGGRVWRLAAPVGCNHVLGLSIDKMHDDGHHEKSTSENACDSRRDTADMETRLMETAAEIAAEEGATF